MTRRQRIRGFIFGPFISATAEDDVPSSRIERLVSWLIVCLLIAVAAPVIGVSMLLLTIAYLALVFIARRTPEEQS